MSYTIADVKADLEGVLHSTDISKVRNPYNLYWRAARNLLTMIDPDETIRIAQIANAIHDEIYDYTIASDTKGKKIIDIRPQVGRTKADSFSQRLSREFDKYKTKGTFQVRNNGRTKSLRLSAEISGSPKTLHGMDSLTANGTWAEGGDATNLTLDELQYIYGSAALNFDLNAAGSVGYIEISDMTDVDLSDHDEVGAIFVNVYIPDPDIITNFIMRWGNDSSNYWSATVTSPHDQDSFKTGWQILKFEWNGATETGTVDPETIDYLRFSVTYDGTAETDIRVDKITCSNGEIYEQEYYSEYLFQSSSGTWKAKPTDETDILNLDEDGYNLFLFECGMAACQQMQGLDARADLKYCQKELGIDDNRNIIGGLYLKYVTDHPSQARRPRSTYYRWGTYNK